MLWQNLSVCCIHTLPECCLNIQAMLQATLPQCSQNVACMLPQRQSPALGRDINTTFTQCCLNIVSMSVDDGQHCSNVGILVGIQHWYSVHTLLSGHLHNVAGMLKSIYKWTMPQRLDRRWDNISTNIVTMLPQCWSISWLCIHMCRRACTFYTHTHICICKYINARMRDWAHTCMCVQAHIHTNTHTHSLPSVNLLFVLVRPPCPLFHDNSDWHYFRAY